MNIQGFQVRCSAKTKRVIDCISILLCIVCGVLVIEFVFDPLALLVNIVEVTSLKIDLPHAQERWKTAQIHDYDVDVQANIPFCGFTVTLSVRQDAVVSVVEHDTVPWKDLEMCQANMHYSALRVPQFLHTVEQEVESINLLETSVKVDFDPNLGYVTYYSSQCSYITHSIGDCFREYKFTNFRPVSEASP